MGDGRIERRGGKDGQTERVEEDKNNQGREEEIR